MPLESEDHEMLVKELRGMDREELKATIDYWEDEAVWSHQLQMLDMVKQELNQRDKERQEQIELLTKSLSSSSRLGRLLSSGKAVLRKFVELK
tara:strand:- start:191 stop:469 length:279 start_codon:yes stop_codon:yes gene_type:complete